MGDIGKFGDELISSVPRFLGVMWAVGSVGRMLRPKCSIWVFVSLGCCGRYHVWRFDLFSESPVVTSRSEIWSHMWSMSALLSVQVMDLSST